MRLLSALMVILLSCSNGTGKADAGAAMNGTGGYSATNAGGSGGSSGNTATGGGSSIYVSINSGCAVVKADHSAPLIDDMEDGDTQLLPNEGRDGFWWWSRDPTSDAALSLEIATIPGGRGSSTKAAHAAGSGASGNDVGGFNLLAGFDGDGGPWFACPYDVSAYTGVQFWARGNDVSVRIKASMMETYPVSYGGICAAVATDACWNDYGTYQTFGDAWKQFSVPFSGMTQFANWGIPTPFNPAHVMAIRFQTDGNVDFDYWIDDISFY